LGGFAEKNSTNVSFLQSVIKNYYKYKGIRDLWG
jgi:hypothetical protein